MCGQHAIQASVPDPNLPPNDPDSCPPQLLQQPPVLFKESCSAKVICMDCRSSSSSFEGRGGGGVGCLSFSGGSKRRECASGDTKRTEICRLKSVFHFCSRRVRLTDVNTQKPSSITLQEGSGSP